MQEIDNLFESVVKPLVLEQYKYAVRWNACLKAVIDKLTDEVMQALAEGQDLDEALSWLAESFLLPDHQNRSVPFFTVIRWYLGEAAEKLIAASGDKL